jgi:hypothetical protein
MPIPQLNAGPLDEVNVAGSQTFALFEKEPPRGQRLLELCHVFVAESRQPSMQAEASSRVRKPIKMSGIGFAASPGTAVLPMCSIYST